MKAAVIQQFGDPDVFRIEDVATPKPRAGKKTKGRQTITAPTTGGIIRSHWASEAPFGHTERIALFLRAAAREELRGNHPIAVSLRGMAVDATPLTPVITT